MSSPTNSAGEVITFYSYKGGTGRSMALANVACLLALRGHRVLAIDWDLEAPGLHRFFSEHVRQQGGGGVSFDGQLDNQPGLIDLFWEYDDRLRNSGLRAEQQAEETIADIVRDIHPEKYVISTELKGLYLLKAGRFDESYSRRVTAFDWRGLFELAPWLIPSLTAQLTDRYEYVLIDSRTGVTDTGGICTMLMPQKLVAVFTPNDQSLLGVEHVVRAALSYRRNSGDLRPLVVFPLPSRIEMSEVELRMQWRYQYQDLFERLFRQLYSYPDCDLTNYFDEVQLQYAPFYSYGEQLAVLRENRRDSLSLGRSYERFTNILTGDSTLW